MSTQSYDIPTLSINDDEIKDLLKYLYKNESLLKENGAIKLIPTSNFKNLLKKTLMNVPLCSTIQQVKQIGNDDLIYSIKTNSLNENKEILNENILLNDETFWLLLPNGSNTENISNISIINGQSLFLKRVERDEFDFHDLPFKSLLKLSGKKFCKKYSSTLIKAHGPGAIFPLSANKQNLYQLNYHHEGGIRHWYIIPSDERKKFEKVFQENKPSICVEHDEIIINPSFFNKFNIKYKKVTQKANEILILASGILSQSFTQDEILCESIHFGLPSWVFDQFTRNSSLCRCGIRYWYVIPSEERKKLEKVFQENKPSICVEHDEIIINPSFFDKFNIKYKKVTQKVNEILILSCGILSQSFTQDEILCESIHFGLPSWVFDQFTRNSSLCRCKLPSNSNKDESVDMNLYNDEAIQKYMQKYFQINIHQNKDSELNEAIPFLDNINKEDLLMDICNESMQFSQFHNEADFNEILSSEDFPNDIFMNNNEPVSLTSEQILNILDIPSSSSNNQSLNKQTYSKNNKLSRITNHNEFIIKKTNNQYEVDVKKILYLSNLNKQITKNHLKNYFIGSTKIIFKQSQLPPHLNYAFIFHHTKLQAEYNRKRAISSSHFGSNCQIEFVKNLSELSNENELNEKWNIVIQQIPENISEDDLIKLFNCQKIKYIPSRIVPKSNTNQKILFGYAFLSFTNTEQVDQVMNNADKYQINNQPLILSYYSKTEANK
ncbi:unnamed protein product [Adineta steineri]|uniref:RRM domain-containing protein n=1 Tax=Adineta steineri TaxID=433720 RepID=A0A815T622_9BILA|nr:unnamed protein product [Adineta steineri]